MKESYVNILCKEIEKEAVCYSNYRGRTVFFGGGTPTTLKTEQLERILCKLKECFFMDGFGGVSETVGEIEEKTVKEKVEEIEKETEEKIVREIEKEAEEKTVKETEGKAVEKIVKETEEKAVEEIEEKTEEEAVEITLECNPGTVSGEDLLLLRKMGFNRLSIGLQSAQNEELKRLGRIHTWEDFLETWHFARKAGFQNINVDIMFALPGQSVESYVNSLRKVLKLRPEHISAYSLIIEEGTPFYERYGQADEQRKKDGEDRAHLLPSEEEERRMYELTEEMLGQEGYHRYEISNYALSGYECRHNMTYWKRGNYLGLGLGAASLMENCRFTKSRDLQEYMETYSKSRDLQEYRERYSEYKEEQQLSVEEQMEEFMFLGLRLTEGISVREFQECFHVPIETIYGDILRKLEGQGLLVRKDDRIFLTKRGVDESNIVLAEFLL